MNTIFTVSCLCIPTLNQHWFNVFLLGLHVTAGRSVASRNNLQFRCGIWRKPTHGASLCGEISWPWWWYGIPADTGRWINVGSTLFQRLRRWINIDSTSCVCWDCIPSMTDRPYERWPLLFYHRLHPHLMAVSCHDKPMAPYCVILVRVGHPCVQQQEHFGNSKPIHVQHCLIGWRRAELCDSPHHACHNVL